MKAFIWKNDQLLFLCIAVDCFLKRTLSLVCFYKRTLSLDWFFEMYSFTCLFFETYSFTWLVFWNVLFHLVDFWNTPFFWSVFHRRNRFGVVLFTVSHVSRDWDSIFSRCACGSCCDLIRRVPVSQEICHRMTVITCLRFSKGRVVHGVTRVTQRINHLLPEDPKKQMSLNQSRVTD